MVAMGEVGRKGAVSFKQERKWGLQTEENVLVKI